MNDKSKADYSVAPVEGFAPEIGRAVWMLEDSRRRTRELLDRVQPAMLDWQPPHAGNSIGTLLYHIAVIETDWLYAEVVQSEFPEDVRRDFPYDVRDSAGRLTVVSGLSMDEHVARLERTRARLLDVFRPMTVDDFRRARSLVLYDVTPEWVLHHLMQHEAEHRGEMGIVRQLAENALS